MFLSFFQEVVDKLSHYTERQVFEGHGRPMEQFSHVQPIGKLGELNHLFVGRICEQIFLNLIDLEWLSYCFYTSIVDKPT